MTPTLLPTDLLPPPAAHGVHAPPEAEPDLPDDEPLYSEDFLARLRERDWLDGEYNAGRLDQYYGEYVISANRTILAHNVFMGAALDAAEAKANELGIPRGLLTTYCISSVEYPMRIS